MQLDVRMKCSMRRVGAVERGKYAPSKAFLRDLNDALFGSGVATDEAAVGLTSQVEDYLAIHGESSFGELMISLNCQDEDSRGRLLRCLGQLIYSEWVERRKEHGLSYYRLVEF
jgi:hypothetical protein